MNDLGPGRPWGIPEPPSPGGNGPAHAQPPRAEAMRGICFCLLYDLCCWLASVRRPVPEDVDEYTLIPLRGIANPRDRLGRYVRPALLDSWEQALQSFFTAGLTLEPELGEAGSFKDRGEDDAGRVMADLRFGNRSSVLDRAQHRHQLPADDWVLSVWLAADLSGYVENATIRRA